MTSRTFVVGVGMTPSVRIETRDWSCRQMVGEAVTAALGDARLGYDAVQRAAVGYAFQPSTAGQRARDDVEMTGVPVIDVNNDTARSFGVRDARTGLQHDLGPGGACAVTLHTAGLEG